MLLELERHISICFLAPRLRSAAAAPAMSSPGTRREEEAPPVLLEPKASRCPGWEEVRLRLGLDCRFESAEPLPPCRGDLLRLAEPGRRWLFPSWMDSVSILRSTIVIITQLTGGCFGRVPPDPKWKPPSPGHPSREMERSGAAGEGPAAGPSPPPPKRNERFLRVKGRVFTYFFDTSSPYLVWNGGGMYVCACDGSRASVDVLRNT